MWVRAIGLVVVTLLRHAAAAAGLEPGVRETVKAEFRVRLWVGGVRAVDGEAPTLCSVGPVQQRPCPGQIGFAHAGARVRVDDYSVVLLGVKQAEFGGRRSDDLAPSSGNPGCEQGLVSVESRTLMDGPEERLTSAPEGLEPGSGGMLVQVIRRLPPKHRRWCFWRACITHSHEGRALGGPRRTSDTAAFIAVLSLYAVHLGRPPPGGAIQASQ